MHKTSNFFTVNKIEIPISLILTIWVNQNTGRAQAACAGL